MSDESEQLQESPETTEAVDQAEISETSSDDGSQAEGGGVSTATKPKESTENSAPMVDETGGGDGPETAADQENAEAAGEDKREESSKNLNQILTMRIPVIVKITEKKMSLERVLKWNLGSMIQFEKHAYQNIDLMVNNRTIGYGQAVKVGENFGLKITQIGDIAETIKSLGGK